jgi:hypothetical protein
MEEIEHEATLTQGRDSGSACALRRIRVFRETKPAILATTGWLRFGLQILCASRSNKRRLPKAGIDDWKPKQAHE